jgi:NodT family efflux transporter outer membrane factor (OMF) lipoprotein
MVSIGSMRAPASFALASVCALLPALVGCAMIGPDYVRPEAPTAPAWVGPAPDGAVEPAAADHREWWRVFGDPVLDRLIDTAYRQNPSLATAGARVLEAIARRGIAIGTLFPQSQDAIAVYERVALSENRANRGAVESPFNDWQIGLDAAWELDVWGRLRRGIESADAEVLASVASYDDVLVSLIAEVATNYVLLRTLEERLTVAQSNVAIQERSWEIADERYQAGAVTQLDSLQATSLLESTRALIPNLEASIRQTESTLCFLLGYPPRDLGDLLGEAGGIPDAPVEIAVGIPADLLRRRPDIRRAERELAAQSAQIGVAKADFLPVFSLTGTFTLAAEDFGDLFMGESVEAFGGPSVRWAILNYGRIANNVRVQDARFQALAGEYETRVLAAQAEVESAMAGFLGARLEVEHLAESVAASERAVEIANLQYREGAADYTRVLNTQQALVEDQDRLASTRGSIGLNLTALYKALGGGWQLREGENFIPEGDAEAMGERTRWGRTLEVEGQAAEVDDAASGTEGAGWWQRWRWRSPRW